MRCKMMIKVIGAKAEDIRNLMKEAGQTIGSVSFIKKSDGSLRKMNYRLHVVDPTTAAKPKGNSKSDKDMWRNDNNNPFSIVMIPNGFNVVPDRKFVDIKNDQMTVLDVNKVVRDESGKVIGRGAWRCVPLNNVKQITVKGVQYIIE